MPKKIWQWVILLAIAAAVLVGFTSHGKASDTTSLWELVGLMEKRHPKFLLYVVGETRQQRTLFYEAEVSFEGKIYEIYYALPVHAEAFIMLRERPLGVADTTKVTQASAALATGLVKGESVTDDLGSVACTKEDATDARCLQKYQKWFEDRIKKILEHLRE